MNPSPEMSLAKMKAAFGDVLDGHEKGQEGEIRCYH